MPVAIKPVTLFENTLATATDVEAIVNVLYAVINALDSANFNLLANWDWLGLHSFVAQKLKVGGAGVGKVLLEYVNSAADRILAFPDPGSNDRLLSIKTQKSRKPGDMENIGFFFGGTGNGSWTVKQANGDDFADTDGNRGYVWLRSPTDGQIIRGKITANVTLSPVGAHWGAGAKGDLAAAILRVYAINDGNTADDFTPRWGLGYQGGFTYVRNTQCSPTATNINLPEEIFTNASIANDNSPCADVGFNFANFDDTGNPNGEDFWAFTATRPGESADGVSQPFKATYTGFSVAPTYVLRWWQFGKQVYVSSHTNGGGSGTSNATDFFMTIPIKPNYRRYGQQMAVVDNSVSQTESGSVGLEDGLALVEIYKSASGVTPPIFTNAGGKAVSGVFTFEAYQP